MEIDKSSQVASMKRGICLASVFFTKHPAPHYLATGDARRVEIEVGEAVEMAGPGYLTYEWRLVRRPPGSGAYLDQSWLQGVDRPGVHLVRISIGGGWMRELELCAYTRDQMYGANPIKSELARLNERSWLQQPGRTTEEIISRLER